MSEPLPTPPKMKPIVIIKTGTMSKPDIATLRRNGLCVVESKEPSCVRFMEPLPESFNTQQWAAISLARTLLTNGAKLGGTTYKQAFGAMYADILLQGDPLTRVPPLERA